MLWFKSTYLPFNEPFRIFYLIIMVLSEERLVACDDRLFVDITQEVASKGLVLVYEIGNPSMKVFYIESNA
jgi:hypothetical protein